MIFFATKAFADTTNQIAATAATAGAPVVPATPAQPSALGMMVPFALMFVVFYFLMIRPQQKKMKEQEDMINKLQKGEEVITRAGIIGKIHGIADKFITLEVDNNVRIKILKSQIETIVPREQKA
jgi:preprotein translocase subunit YajC